MKRKNTTRNALFTSIISLLLCVSMLVGTTFAWFTDEVKSGMNTIAAGNLDVELHHSDKNDSGYVNSETTLFNDVTKWEPGVVVYENFKVENVGDLALKYQLSIKFENETKVTVDGVEHGLSEVLKVGVVEGGFTGGRAEAQNIAFDESLSTFDLSGVLEGNTTSKTYGVVIYWAPNSNDVDNIFNMNNKNQDKELSIDLGINLFATQEVYESDSFGDDYDEGLILPELGEDTVLVEKDGIQYYYDENGNYVLYRVTEAYTGDTVNVPEGVDAIHDYAFAYNTNVKTVVLSSTVRSLGRGFDSSSVEKVVLNEGLEKIDSRAFRSTTNLQEVVIPATVKVIEDNAFQKSGIKNIVIPATVETIGETAFGASLIETVTFEGNTSIQGYAFRGCTELNTVTMNGDDVTFIPSTLNGRNSMWFCNGESGNPNTSDIDFYVVNETVAARVKTAMGAEAGNTDVYIMDGESKITYVTVKKAAELQSALDAATGTTIISFTADITGDVTATQKPDVKITIDGGDRTYNGSIVIDGKSARYETTGLTIQNVNFAAETLSKDAFVNLGDGTSATRYTNNVTVKDCTFSYTGEGDKVAIKSYTGGDWNLTVDGCTVNTGMHSMLQVTNVEKGLEIVDCKVYSKNGINLNNTPALEMNGCEFDTQGYAVRVGVNGSVNETAKNFKIADSTLTSANDDGDAVIIFRDSATKATLDMVNTTLTGNPQISGATADTTILLEGKHYVTSSEELTNAVANGVTDILLADGNYKLSDAAKGKTLTISGSEKAVIEHVNQGEDGMNYCLEGSTVTFNGVTIKTTSGTYRGFARSTAIEYNDCHFVGSYTLGAGSHTFNNCHFNLQNNYVWTWGGTHVLFDGCTFEDENGVAKAILVHNTVNTEVTVKDCTFVATTEAKTWDGIQVAAVSIDPNGAHTAKVTFEGTNSVSSAFNGNWQIKYEEDTALVTVIE